MSLKRELIKTINVVPSNLEYCAKKRVINGSLLMEIERIMNEYHNKKLLIQDVQESKPKCNFCNDTGTDPLSEETHFVCIMCK